MSKKFYLMTSLIVVGTWGAWSGLSTAWADPISVIPPQTMPTEKANERVSLQALKSMRDPFKRLGGELSDVHDEKVKTELETAPVSDFKMVGVLTGPYKTRALVRGPSGNVYPVSDGTRIGTQNGYVRKVLTDRIIVNEIMQDVVGDKELVTSEIKLMAKPSDRLVSVDDKNDVQIVNRKKEESGKPASSPSSSENQTLKPAPASQAPAAAPAAAPARAASTAQAPVVYGGSNFNLSVPAPISAPKMGATFVSPSNSSQQTAGSK